MNKWKEKNNLKNEVQDAKYTVTTLGSKVLFVSEKEIGKVAPAWLDNEIYWLISWCFFLLIASQGHRTRIIISWDRAGRLILQ